MKNTVFFATLFFLVLSAYAQQYTNSIDNKMLSYHIKPGDILEVSVYGEPEMLKTVRVSENGKINYPFIGEIKVSNLTIKEAIDKIETMLKEGYFVTPQVNIFVKEYAKFFVVGAVNREGSYELKGNLNIMEGIAMAGGARENADLSKIKVLRKQDSNEQEHVLDLDSQGRTFLLEPGDRIVLEEEGQISVLGEVNRAANYYLKKDTTLFDAIAMAGGARNNADLSKIKIIRKDEAKEYVVNLEKGGKEFILKPGDAVFIKSYDKISVLGAVTRPGSYDFKPGLTAVDAVALAGGFNELANQNAVKVIRQTHQGARKIFNVPVADILRGGDKSKDLLLEEGDTVSVGESMF